ncbi:TPA: S-methyl-5'-thioadenosine phosphorylase [bacterium]|nr:S-methyl-5'-thioadenosine phosphorylase [bacterium]
MRGLIGIIGGSGIYEMDGLQNIEEIDIDTPFGKPSDSIVLGTLSGRRLAFLPRHGRGHRIMPGELNFRANIWAMKKLGVEWLLSFSAVGSLKEEIKPRDVVIPDQIFDRTLQRPRTFFGNGIVAHISFASPFCPVLRKLLMESSRKLGLAVHDGGTYVCIEGPAFSTKAESAVNRMLGFSIVGMTAVPEARLAREAEIAYATVALSTDYDVWHDSGEVSVEMVMENLRTNTENVKRIIKEIVPQIPTDLFSPSHDALKGAIMTDRSIWPDETVKRLGVIIERYL